MDGPNLRDDEHDLEQAPSRLLPIEGEGPICELKGQAHVRILLKELTTAFEALHVGCKELVIPVILLAVARLPPFLGFGVLYPLSTPSMVVFPHACQNPPQQDRKSTR